MRWPYVLLTSTLLACFGTGEDKPREERPASAEKSAKAPEKSSKTAKAPEKGAKTKVAAGDRKGSKADLPPRPKTVQKGPGGDVPTVIFAVLDTVRADHMEMCGYERPNTPYLKELSERPNASISCHAYSPGTWTVPSHSSFFTGLSVPEHGTDQAGLILPEDVPTLSETMRRKGYRALYVAANPTMSAKSGLDRGFEHMVVGKGLTGMRGKQVAESVQKVLDEVKDDEPIFLFVNILDAHDPYPEIPKGVKWAKPQEELDLKATEKGQNETYHKYIRGELSAKQATEYQQAVQNGYDYGILEADRALEHVMRILRQAGRLDHGYRMVITSDHGEFLGEHNLFRHGCYTLEPVVRVPFVFFDSRLKGGITLPEPFSAINAFDLVADGKLRDEPALPQAFSKARKRDVRGCANMAAHWATKDEKLVWKNGEHLFYNLAKDPGEAFPTPLGEHASRPVIEDLAARHEAHIAKGSETELSADRVEELRQLGYMD